MKIELINEMSVDDLMESQFYDDRVKNNLTRRDFLKYTAVGTMGLVIPVSMPRETSADFGSLIRAGIQMLTLIFDIWESAQKIKGNIVLINDQYKSVKGDLKLSLLNDSDSSELGKEFSNYSVPERKVREYKFEDGPEADVSQDTKASVLAETRIARKKYSDIVIKA